uniref:N-acetyltransferase domain-containing protein n=1 Tax=Lactuca sativa TaxID=4236 RepID=A0A9R1VBA8_LACSA|nr:hypothetical protein LSAT_V11C600304620 [Lactuca sativa]
MPHQFRHYSLPYLPHSPLILGILQFPRFIRGNAFEPWFSKMGEHHNTFRGYIVMFVVLKPYRHRGIGKKVSLSFLLLESFYNYITCYKILKSDNGIRLGIEKGIKVCYSHANHSDRIRYRGSYSKRIYDRGLEDNKEKWCMKGNMMINGLKVG